jgi:hypothetical protein
MKSKTFALLLGASLLLTIFLAGTSEAFFVATVQNLRGAMYQGAGPTPGHASEMALVKCSQDSVIPGTCRVMCVRMECPPPVCAPPPRKAKMSKAYQGPPTWGRPMN